MAKLPSVIGIIPARFASTRFPGKPLATLMGKTLIQHTYENSLKCQILDDVVVATDDARIYEHVLSFGGNVVMTSSECPTGTDRLAEVVKNYPQYQHAEIIVNIQGDEPCVNPQTIEQAVNALREDSIAVMSTAVVLIDLNDAHNVNTVKCVFNQKGHALYFSRSLIPGRRKENLRPAFPYYKHIGMYVYKKDFLLLYSSLAATPLQLEEDLEQLKILEHGYTIKIVTIDSVSIDINVPEDIKKFESELWKQNTSS